MMFVFFIGCFWVYWDQESFEHVREAVERSLLSNLEQDDHTQNNQVSIPNLNCHVNI